mmetsp:Transcript_26237/g.40037  ORF Transcript_26237/g.40037 Transcript_26237/m.40037 type:complete len:146 (+) Transcript_26237:182-619(+)
MLTDIIVGCLMLIIFLVSICKAEVGLVRFLIPLNFIRVLANSCMMYGILYNYTSYDLTMQLVQNMLRVSVSFQLNKFVMERTSKRINGGLFFFSVFFTMFLLASFLVKDFISLSVEHFQDILFLCFCFYGAYYIDHQIVENEQQD